MLCWKEKWRQFAANEASECKFESQCDYAATFNMIQTTTKVGTNNSALNAKKMPKFLTHIFEQVMLMTIYITMFLVLGNRL